MNATGDAAAPRLPAYPRPPARIVLTVALLAAALAGCAARDRANPLDPENSKTGGRIPGFNAIAGNRQVEIRWTRLTQTGVVGYRLQRWLPGDLPVYIGDLYPSQLAGAVDTAVVNTETYIYRLVAYFASGDTTVSPPDTATPGLRQFAVLSFGIEGFVGLTPDARDVLFTHPATEAYEDMEVDEVRGVLWLTMDDAGEVERLHFDGSVAGPTIPIHAPADVTVSHQRGVGWVAAPSAGRVYAFGLDSVGTIRFVSANGAGRVAEAGTQDPTLWVGNDDGEVFRYFFEATVPHGTWSLGGRVAAIALDQERERAWVVTRVTGSDALHLIDGIGSTVTPMLQGLHGVIDIAFDPDSRLLWMSERGTPEAGNGRLTCWNDQGVLQASVQPLEPFGITIDPQTGNCWASDLKSNRLVEVSPTGAILRWSASVDVPYGVRISPGSADP